jgi:hypothetical protein
MINLRTRRSEPNLRAWVWRILVGPALILDGLIATVTLGMASGSFTLNAPRNLAMARINYIRKGR